MNYIKPAIIGYLVGGVVAVAAVIGITTVQLEQEKTKQVTACVDAGASYVRAPKGGSSYECRQP